MFNNASRGFLGFIIFIVGFTAGATFTTLYYLQRIEAVTDRLNIKINDQFIVAEIARTESEREKGLSGRDGIGLNEGMYFIFSEPSTDGFWMKGMKFPIDIVWIAESEIVGLEERVPPEPGVPDRALTVYAPPEAVDKVLELAAGRVRLLRAKVGDHVKIRRLLGGVSGGARIPSFQELADAFQDWNEVNRGVR